MDGIGGYFSLELPFHEEYHKDALHLNTGRNCLEYILITKSYKKVYIPYYCCEAILTPIKRQGIEYSFYQINQQFELTSSIELNNKEALLYINYFGIKQDYVDYLADKYGNNLIVDNTQAFFSNPIRGIDTFYSCRKFFGVPDGAYLYTNKQNNQDFARELSYMRMSHLIKRIEFCAEDAYSDFLASENAIDSAPIRWMSQITARIMQSIDYDHVALRRKENYRFLDNALRGSNQLQFQMSQETVPMVYPYLSIDSTIKKRLILNKIYVATYWPNVLQWCSSNNWEYKIAKDCVFIPLDQRYSIAHMQMIVNTIL